VRQNHFQQHGSQIWRIVDGNAERSGEQTRFVFALSMLRIKTIISELPNIYFGTFRLGEQHKR
jgi:hypothetical protein